MKMMMIARITKSWLKKKLLRMRNWKRLIKTKTLEPSKLYSMLKCSLTGGEQCSSTCTPVRSSWKISRNNSRISKKTFRPHSRTPSLKIERNWKSSIREWRNSQKKLLISMTSLFNMRFRGKMILNRRFSVVWFPLLSDLKNLLKISRNLGRW